MGESRGGEGGTGTVTTDQVARALARDYSNDGREVDQIHVQFMTGGLYAVEVAVRGEPVPERYILAVDPAVHEEARPIAVGDSAAPQEEK